MSNTAPLDTDWLTPEAFADEYKISVVTVYSLVRKKALDHVRLGRAIRVRRPSINGPSPPENHNRVRRAKTAAAARWTKHRERKAAVAAARKAEAAGALAAMVAAEQTAH